MDLYRDSMHPAFKTAIRELDDYCKSKGIFCNLLSHATNMIGILVKKQLADDIIRFLRANLTDRIMLTTDDKRKDGILLIFTLASIEDGYWKVQDPKAKGMRKSINMSIFANDEDAKAVREKRTIYQSKEFKRKIENIIEVDLNNLRIPTMEPGNNPGVTGGLRTHGGGENQQVRSYNQRQNAYDNPTTLKSTNIEGDLPQAECGFLPLSSDPNQLDNGHNFVTEPLSARIDSLTQQQPMITQEPMTTVVPDDIASKEAAAGPMQTLASKQKMMGSVLPNNPDVGGDPRQETGAPVSNVRSTPPIHTGNTSDVSQEPKITVRKMDDRLNSALSGIQRRR